MVIKDNLLHTGWSYGNGDDQYDNESVGSTKNVTEMEKFEGKMTKNKQNGSDIKMCNKNNGHTDDQGWTTISATSNRKPKTKINQQPNIDSVIASINLDTRVVRKGAPEAKIESPVRENRCTVPEKADNIKEIELKIKNTIKQNLVPPKAGEITTSKEEGHEVIKMITMATNGTSEAAQIETNTGTNKESNNGQQINTANGTDKDSNNTNRNGDKRNNSNNNKGRVTVMTPGEMDTYAFTISWRPDQKVGQDGKIIIKMLMREMAHRTPSIIFHPTNSATSPVPRDINNINNDFPTTPASFDDYFDVMRNRDNTNQRTFMKVTMPHDEKELQRKLSNYLFYNKLYMNSPFIDDNTLEHVGFIENGHSRLVYRPNIEMKIRNGLKEVMKGDLLTPQQTAQLKHLSSPIRVECQRGTIRAGPAHNQIVCEGIVLKTAKSQSKIAMELLAMLPETILGNHYRIIPKSLGNLLGYELYGRILADTVDFQDKLRPITILHCHPSVFEDMYDNVKLQNSKHVEVHKFIIENCGAISIEETSETAEKGKYIVVVPESKVDSARTAIGKMFQEFQQNDGRQTALACLSAYQNYPLVNDNVTISGHAQKLSEKIRNRYRNRPQTPTKNQSSSASYSYHGSTTAMHDQQEIPAQVPTGLRSIVRNSRRSNNTINSTTQWPASPVTQQQQQQQHQQRQQPVTTSQVEDRTVMSNLSPDDSAKTMMTNVSRMVETLGSAVNTLARESANTNDTMKQMMMQQTATMNNLMLIMTKNEERRLEVPNNIIQQTSTPGSTITNSQHSLSQQSTNTNKRKSIEGTTDEGTINTTPTEASTATTKENEYENEDEDEIEAMLEEQEDGEVNEQTQNRDGNSSQDITMTDGEQPNVAGDFETQFKDKTKSTDMFGSNAPSPGANRQ
jgi:hypothetical protein